MYKKKYISFSTKISLCVLAILFLLLISISFLFYHTGTRVKHEAFKQLESSSKDISRTIDEIVLNVYNVSDAFAIDDRLLYYTQKDFSGNPMNKRKATVQIVNQLFASYDLLRRNEKMAAFYTQEGEVFNFIDPNNDEEECEQQLEYLDINNKDKLARFFWYPVRDNFLKKDKTGIIRKDMAIIGSRRAFSNLQSSYVGVHIFAINEESIYSVYKDIAKQYDADIYIINGNGELMSTSNEKALRLGLVDDELKDAVLNREYERFEMNYGKNVVCVHKSAVNDWITVINAPMNNITSAVDSLFNWIFFIMILTSIIVFIIVFAMYRRFMKPVEEINTSMKKVYNGDMTAYVTVNKNNELGQMMKYYNSMLESINNNVREKLELEEHKRKLEFDVLLNQINPHFLYNTLETIVWKSTEAGHPEIGRIAASLGRMYRLSVSRGNLFISIKQEIEHVMLYLKIQRSRYENSIDFEINVDYEAVQGFYTLKILLQPLVENSLLHGMEGIERQLKIRITIKVLEKTILFKITDNGCGMTREHLEKVRRKIKTGEPIDSGNQRRKSTGIGMHNVSERLRIYFGIEDGLKIYSKKGIGTVLLMEIPKIDMEEAEERNNS